MKTKLHRAEFIKAGVSAGLIAAGGIVCIVLITYSDLHHKSSVVGSSLLQVKNAQKAVVQNDALLSLVDNKDVAQPISSRLHALSFQEIMRENNNDVDSLGPAFDPMAGRFVGPDGLSDAGDPADIALLNSLSGDNQIDADDMNAMDAKHGVGSFFQPPGFRQDAVSGRHDMSHESAAIDARSSRNLENIRRKQGSFKVESDPSSNIEPQHLSSKFHALASIPTVGTGRSEGVPMSSRFSLVHHDGQMRIGQSLKDPFTVLHPHAASSASLGLEPVHRSAEDISSRYADSEAEALADPSGDVSKGAAGDKGIWVEPGSNKGYDSFALDSLQIKGDA